MESKPKGKACLDPKKVKAHAKRIAAAEKSGTPFCGGCLFFHRNLSGYEGSDKPPSMGTCHLWPRVPMVEDGFMVFVYPEMSDDDDCGQFVPKIFPAPK